jgi:hypothetical protein
MHMQLAAIDPAEPARGGGAEHLPRALELVGALATLIQRDARGVELPVGGVEVVRSEPETGAVDCVEGGED